MSNDQLPPDLIKTQETGTPGDLSDLLKDRTPEEQAIIAKLDPMPGELETLRARVGELETELAKRPVVVATEPEATAPVEEPAPEPKPKRKLSDFTRMNVWPVRKHVALRFGAPSQLGLSRPEWEAANLVLLDLPYPMVTAWTEPDPHTGEFDPQPVRQIRVHAEVVSSLGRILNAIHQFVYEGDMEALRKDGMHLFGGAHTYRPSVGLSTLSLHGYGAAIDLNPAANPLGKKWEKGKGMMPAGVIEVFESEGWLWGGDSKSRPDCMHFEATRLK